MAGTQYSEVEQGSRCLPSQNVYNFEEGGKCEALSATQSQDRFLPSSINYEVMSAMVALNYSLSVMEQIKINCGRHVSQLSRLDSRRSHLGLYVLRILGQEGLGHSR